ncbi:hypothetical protein CORMATOL_00187 [Corynebacterium matruchotii ATCC 33806]|uniref:Uncharacterized protein n=1 Tax=Corynebacterium matruchotii ATCC 33806 TaxID=566549 RepID=C0DZP2_9CORY|nr:hypothetical protein CORMATOL_00187 [Corynebacterium matruchotii ATCC 33806]
MWCWCGVLPLSSGPISSLCRRSAKYGFGWNPVAIGLPEHGNHA